LKLSPLCKCCDGLSKAQLWRPRVASANDPFWAEKRSGVGAENVKDRQLGGFQVKDAAAWEEGVS